MSNAKRKKLRERIEAGQLRQAQRALISGAEDARDKLSTVAREHPILLIAGGLAIGVALSTLIPRSPTRKLSKNAIAMLATVAELGIAYGKQAMETADEVAQGARDELDRFGDTVSANAEKLKDKVKATAGQ